MNTFSPTKTNDLTGGCDVRAVMDACECTVRREVEDASANVLYQNRQSGAKFAVRFLNPDGDVAQYHLENERGNEYSMSES